MTTIHGLVSEARSRLVRAGVEPGEARTDAEVLARRTLGWNRTTYLSEGRSAPPDNFVCRYERVLERRERREPVSLITGHREFWGLDFEVTPAVLTPRPETEILVEEALFCLEGSPPAHIIDIGTGSGCLAISVAHEAHRCRVTAIDVSLDALRVARRNVAHHGLSNRVHLVCSSLLSGLEGARNLGMIMANLPYIPESEMARLPPEVRDHEPRTALSGGDDGLDTIRALVTQADDHLSPGGRLILECGTGQSESVSRHVSCIQGLEVIRIRQDLQGIPRVLVIEKQTPPERL